MDNLSDFIPLLLIVGSVIISIVKSSEKKKAKQDQNKTTLPKGIPTIPTIPTERPSAAPVLNLPKMRSAAVTPPPAQRKRVEADVVFNPEVKRSVRAASEEHVLNEVVETGSFVFDAVNIDELKKAVIYSEILNRKEY